MFMNSDIEARTVMLEAQVAELERENQLLREQIVYLSRELQQSKLTQILDNKNSFDGMAIGSSLQMPPSTKKLKKAGSTGVMKKLVDPSEEASRAYISLLESILDSISVAFTLRLGDLRAGEHFYPGFSKITHRITDIFGLHTSGPLRRPDVLLPVLQIFFESMTFQLKYKTIDRDNKDTSLDLAAEQAKTSRDHVLEAMFNSSSEKGYLFEPQTQYWKKKLKAKPSYKLGPAFDEKPAMITLFSDERCTDELISILKSMRGCNTAFKKYKEINAASATNGRYADERNFSVDVMTPQTLFAQKKTSMSHIFVNLLIIMLARRGEDITTSIYELLGEYEAQPVLKKFFAFFFHKNDGVAILLLSLVQVEERDLNEVETAVFQLMDCLSEHLSLSQKVGEILSKYLWDKLNSGKMTTIRDKLRKRYAFEWTVGEGFD